MIALEPGQQWLPQFRLIKEIAVGKDQRPRVWLAAKQDSGLHVVLKFLRPGPPSPLLVRRLADWRATRIPGFMPLLGVHTAGDQMALELPFVPDENSALRGAPYPSWSVWLEHVVGVIANLHRDGFIHGDVKLSNIRRDASGRPVLADPWMPGDGKSPFTASPERLQGAGISAQDDLYAVGALIHELATGYPPRYPGAEEIAAKTQGRLPVEVSAAMNAMLSSAAEKRPSLERLLVLLEPLNETDRQPADNDSGPITTPRPAPPKSPPSPLAQNARRRATTAAGNAALASLPTQAPANSPRQVRASSLANASSPTRTPASSREVPLEIVRSPAAPAVPRVPVPATAHASASTSTLAPAPVPAPPPRAELRTSAPQVEFLPLVAGSPSWERPSERERADHPLSRVSPFPSRTRIWFWPAVVILLIAAVAAFVWLPQQVKDDAMTQVSQLVERSGLKPAPSPPGAASQPPDLRAMGEKKLAAEQARDRASRLQSDLINGGATARPMVSYLSGADAFRGASEAFEQRDFDKAARGFNDAERAFDVARTALPGLHRAAVAAGDAALAQCQRDQAIDQYKYALALQPGDQAAQQGILRARVCDAVIARVNEGSTAEQAGERDAAQRSYQAALQLDPNSPAAQQAANALNARDSDERFGKQIALALQSLRERKYGAAAAAIADADRLRPGSAEVQRLSAQLDEVRGTERLQSLAQEASASERGERWGDALAAYRSMLSIDPTLVTAQEGAARADSRVQLDAEIAGYIASPQRLSAAEVRAAAASALARGRDLPARGPHLDSELSQLAQLLSQFDSPAQVALQSDGLTDVTILRIGRIGTFNDRVVNLKPGKYVVVGSRLGFRDVRRDLIVAPNSPAPHLQIRCEETI